jgi:hypothetical protein
MSAMATTTTPTPGRWTDVLQRWPTMLAIGMTAVTLGGDADKTVEGYGEALPYLALLYLAAATLRRRNVAWPGLVAAIAVITMLRLVDVVPLSVVAVAIALVVLVWDVASGHLRRSGTLQAQALGMVGFGALALVGLAVDPDLGRYLIAAGWFLHGVWDFVHLRLDAVVARSYAEWCAVIDVLVAVQLVFLV